MATYLIDYENANKDGLNGVTKLTERDTVIIFYSDKADRMTFGLHRRLNETAATIEYRKVDVGGHNALDFQLATYLGYLLAQNPEEEYCVVSNDRGFQFLVGFWKKPQYNVCLTREIAASPQAEERRQAHDQANRQRQLERNARQAEEKAEAQKNLSDEPVQANAEAAVSTEAATGSGAVEEMSPSTADASGDLTIGTSVAPESQNPEEKEFTSRDETGLSEKSQNERRNDRRHDRRRDRRHASGEPRQQLREPEPRMALDQTVVSLLPGQSVNDAMQEINAAITSMLQEEDTSVPSEQAPEVAAPEENHEEGRKKTGKAQGRRRGGRSASKRKPKVNETRQKEVANILSGEILSEEDLVEITSYVEKYKTKQGVNNALVRRFGTQRAGEVYQKIKPLLKDKKGKSESA